MSSGTEIPARSFAPWCSILLGILFSAISWFTWKYLASFRGDVSTATLLDVYFLAIAFGAVGLGHTLIATAQLVLLYMIPTASEGDHRVWGVWSGALIGVLERPFFCLAVAHNLGGCVVAMFAWITLRNVALWSKINADPARGFIALILSFSSMFVALVSGIFLRHLLF